MSESKTLQLSQTLQCILADFNHTEIWMVSILPQISNSSRLFSKLLVSVSSALTTIGIIDNPTFHSFLVLLYLSIFLLPYIYIYSEVRWNSKIH